jgi:hypothetical protein
MDPTEAKVAELLSSRPIVWSGATFSCPDGLYVCDCLYHGEAAFFPGTTEIHNFGFVLDEQNDNRIVFSVRELELSEVTYEGDYSADTGGLFLVNGPVTTQSRSETLSRAIEQGVPREQLASPGLTTVYGLMPAGNETCFFINAGWGSGGYEVFHSRTCHILDHCHVRWSLAKE